MGFLFIIMLTFSLANEKVFVACEGNFYQANGSIWTLSDGEVFPYNQNPLGEVVQSLYVNDNELYVIVNGTGNIQVFDITDGGLVPTHFIDMQYSGPREMIVIGEYLYFTNWYTADVKKINLNTWEVESEIPMPGLPEDIIFNDGLIYVSITMEYDWTDGDTIVTINPGTDQIIETHYVGEGPGDLLAHDGDVYIARTYYDSNWNAFYGTSKIGMNGDVIVAGHGGGSACGGSIHSFDENIYRAYDGGIAKLDENLEILPETRIGNFEFENVYSIEVINDFIYFGLSDFQAPDDVVVLNSEGTEVARYEVGALPGDFAVWNSCVNNGDMNVDNLLNVSDIVSVIYLILDQEDYLCTADLNADGEMNILDVVQMVQEILGIESFRGAANWLDRHFPELKVNERIKALLSEPKNILK